MHQKFCGVFRSDSFAYHFVVANDCSCLKHSAQNCLLAHKVRLNFRNKARFKNARLASAHSYSQSFCISPAFSFRVIVRVNGDKVRNTKSSLEFMVNFCARTFWSAHYNCDVRANLHSLFNDIESVRVPQSRAFLHSLHNFCNNRSVLLVRSKVSNKVSSWNHLIISTNFKSVFCGILPRLAFFCDCRFPQSITNIKPRIAQAKALVQTLRTATNDYNFFALKSFYAVSKFFFSHRTAMSQLKSGFSPRNRIKIIVTHFFSYKKSMRKYQFPI